MLYGRHEIACNLLILPGWLIILFECSIGMSKLIGVIKQFFFCFGVYLKYIEVLAELFDGVALATIVEHELA